VDLAFGVEQLQEIAGGYLGERAALGGHDDRRPPDGRVPRSCGNGAAIVEGCPQPGESGLAAGPLKVAG
jgi:hypothetical protein